MFLASVFSLVAAAGRETPLAAHLSRGEKQTAVHNQRCFCQHLPLSLSGRSPWQRQAGQGSQRSRGGCRLLSSPGEAGSNNSDLPLLPNTHSCTHRSPLPLLSPPACRQNNNDSSGTEENNLAASPRLAYEVLYFYLRVNTPPFPPSSLPPPNN